MSSCSKLRPTPYFTVRWRGWAVMSGMVCAGGGRRCSAAVDTHVGVVDEAEEAEVPLRRRERSGPRSGVAELELEVLAAGAAEVPVEVDAVGDGGHQGEGVAGGPGVVVVLGDGAVGVAAGVGGVVPGAVVVDGPVQELEVGVGAGAVDIEEVGEAHACRRGARGGARGAWWRARTGCASASTSLRLRPMVW